MAWVVDSCILLDIALADIQFGEASARCVASRLADGVVACPVSQIEIVPQFGGQLAQVRHFLKQSGIQCHIDWIEADTEAAANGWAAYVKAKRAGRILKRPIADIQIGGFAMRFQGIITRNPGDFRPWFPELEIIEP
ncbi:MAG: type II toxin-antitoxin system VapC family toxin [Verrucomicrobia bacterium]|nr:type II toxin-antitoxin system VapC family toxin [Verrucomicrobiota bacterium]